MTEPFTSDEKPPPVPRRSSRRVKSSDSETAGQSSSSVPSLARKSCEQLLSLGSVDRDVMTPLVCANWMAVQRELAAKSAAGKSPVIVCREKGCWRKQRIRWRHSRWTLRVLANGASNGRSVSRGRCDTLRQFVGTRVVHFDSDTGLVVACLQ